MKGTITITEAALGSLIGLAAHEVPGVVGMAPANLREGILKILRRADSSQGVLLSKDKEKGTFSADLYVVVAYGVNIPTVARNITERVEHATKTLAGIELGRTTVHAVGVSNG